MEGHRIRPRAGVISGVPVVNGTSTCRETLYALFLRPAILNQRGGNSQATGRMSEHIEAAILLERISVELIRNLIRSFPRKRESRGRSLRILRLLPWVPAFAGRSGHKTPNST